MLILMSILVPLLVGGAVAWLAPRYNWRNTYGQPMRVTRIEFGVTSFVIVVVAVLVTLVWGPNVAKASVAGGYHQFYNGSIVYAGIDPYKCSRDGPCTHEYDCDPHQVWVVDQEAYTDSDGNYHPEQGHYETRYHDCPYATEELTYYLQDNLGRKITVASHIFEAHPHVWRSGSGIPGNVPEGDPARWLASKRRLQAGDAEPVTMVNNYTNYILPTEGTLSAYSADIQSYQKRGLLPPHTANLKHGPLFDLDTRAQKMQFVHMSAPNAATWQDRLMRFNAALGIERQGDLHIVAVPASQVPNPDAYMSALRAYWLNGFGKWGFPKNGIIVVLGVSDDGTTITWARAKTGMPVGNGEMLTAISFQLAGKPFDPDVVLGKITARVQQEGSDNYKAVYTHGSGLLDSIMFTQYPFLRACMNCKDKTDHGTSYVYLKDSIPVSGGAKVLMFFIVLLISLVFWGADLFFDPVGYLAGRTSARSRFDTY